MSETPPPVPVPPNAGGPPPIPTGNGAAPVEHPPGYGGAPAAVPAYGEVPAMRIANPGWRALAFVIDGFGTFALTTVLVFGGLFLNSGFGFYAIPVIPIGSFLLATILTATVGVTPGKALVGIRVVHVETGRPIGGWAIIRSLVIVSPLVIGYVLLALVDTLDIGAYANVFDSPIPGLLPALIWIVLFVLVCTLPRHRGVEDLLARSVVVRSR